MAQSVKKSRVPSVMLRFSVVLRFVMLENCHEKFFILEGKHHHVMKIITVDPFFERINSQGCNGEFSVTDVRIKCDARVVEASKIEAITQQG